MATRKPFRPEDLLTQVLVSDAAVSPDGSTLVFARRTIERGKERTRLWAVGMEGGRPQRLTTEKASDTSPTFSPDSGTLAFLSDRGSKPGSEKSQPFLLKLSGGSVRSLPALPEGAEHGEAESVAFSPTGDALLTTGPSGVQRFIVGKPEAPTARRITELNWRYDGRWIRDEHTSAWVVPITGRGKPVRVTDPAYDVGGAFWSPNGKSVGFFADLDYDGSGSERHLAWAVSRAGGKPRSLVPGFGGLALAGDWGKRGLVFSGCVEPYIGPRNVDLFIADRDAMRQLAADRDQTFFGGAWSESLPIYGSIGPLWIDGDRVVVLAQRRGRSIPWLVRPGEDSLEPLLPLDTTTDCAMVATGGGRVAVVASVDGEAGEAYELDLDGGGLRRLTRQTERWFGPFRRSPEEIVVKHPEGHEVQGWLTRATGHENERRPVIFEIHGGPYDSAGPARLMEELALADAGYHVFALNPRGSVGFGQAFTQSLFGRWGEPDGSDLLAVLDWAGRKGLADRKRVGLLGLSYGGFMVNHLLGAFPGRFKAAVSENPYTDAIADIGAGDAGLDTEPEVGIGPFPEALDEWLATSPIMRIHRNTAPLLLLQADADLRCPPVHSEIVFTILRRLGRTVEMVRYPDERHIQLWTGRPDRRVDRLTRILDWYDRYL